jgi:ribonuclease HI
MPLKRKHDKFYAVRAGRLPGIYTTWDDAKAQVVGFSGAIFKSFLSREEAESYMINTTPIFAGEIEPPNAKRQKPVDRKTAEMDTLSEELDKLDPVSPDDKCLVVYVDGHCAGNHQKDETKRRCGIGIYFPSLNMEIAKRLPSEFRGVYLKKSNNSAELFAIVEACLEINRMMVQREVVGYNSVLIRSDSKIAVGICLEKYAGKKLPSLTKLARIALGVLRDTHKITVHIMWVKGHATDIGNLKADELSRKGGSMPEDL